MDATAYLASFGITLSAVTPGSSVLIIGEGAPGLVIATSPPNFFTQYHGNNPETMTLNFPNALSKITFSRCAMTYDSKPQWTAEALNVQGTVVASVGEPLTATGSAIPAQQFTLSGTGITALRISSNNEDFTNLSGVPIDDLTLVGGCQVDPGSLKSFAAAPYSHDRQPTSMIGIFRPSIGGQPMSLKDAAQACGLAGFDWQQEVTALPCPSPFSANPLDVAKQNVCPGGSLTASLAFFFNDPPPGGYTSYLIGYNPFPFYYYSNPNPFFLTRGIVNEEQSPTPTGVVIDDGSLLAVTLDDMQLAFYDAPANPYLALPLEKGISMGFATSLVGVGQGGNVVPLFDSLGQPLQWTWTDSYNDTSGGIPTTFNTRPVDPGGTGGITITRFSGIPQIPPSVTCAATPNTLWPPNGNTVVVTVSGTVTVGTQAIPPGGIVYTVIDEYGQVQPSGVIALAAGGGYSSGVPLIAARNGNDKDGRTYTINVSARDAIGNVGSCSAVVTVPHDQGN